MTTITNHTTAAAETVREAFEFRQTVPELSGYVTEQQLRSDYENQSGPTHWFAPDTLRFFGSRNREMVTAGIMVECQTNAPEGVGRYLVTAWVLDPGAACDHCTPAGRITPQDIGRFHTRAAAKRFAIAAAAAWPEAVAL